MEKSDRDIKQLAWLDGQSKLEITSLKQQRVEAEEQLQVIK